MSASKRVSYVLGARDPGRARLTAAAAVSAGVLASALFALTVVHLLNADSAFLAMAVFLSVQAGNVVRDRSPGARVVTAALLVPVALLAVLLAAVLSAWRPAVIVVFILLAGVAMWIRRFGPRATAMGTMGFLAYFFTLFMQPTTAELPAYSLLAIGAVSTQLVARLLVGIQRPRRELALLLTELRIASAAALRAALAPEHTRTLRARLARLDAIGRAVTSWQQRFRTDQYIDCDEETLAERVLDARIDTEEVCFELAEATGSRHGAASAVQGRSLTNALAVLDEQATAAQIAEAASWAEQVLAGAHHSEDGRFAYPMAQSTLAHARVRALDLSQGSSTQSKASPTRSPASHRSDATTPKLALRWRPWREWTPTSRLAVQAMIAASIATIVGEAISASRWYWAVTTAFVIFLSTTTRSDILTRAYRRVTGTAAGILVGVGAAYLAHGNTAALIAICVVGIFGMLYFGPVNYVYSSFFMTVMLVAIYGMLGVLHGDILELRLEETLMGAVIGVLCAYLILSSNSRPALVTKVDVYFDALDALLLQGSDLLAARGRRSDVLARVQALEAAQVDVDQTVSAMSAAFLAGRHEREESAIHLMYIATRSAVRFAQMAMAEGSSLGHRPALQGAIADTRELSARVRRQLDGSVEPPTVFQEAPPDLPSADRSPSGGDSAATSALRALERLDWAMERLSDVVAPVDRRSKHSTAIEDSPAPR
ncbi:FUSC family protein [Agromyces sp. NPDC055520]